jgi:thiamine pyrophosphate-dependent acetolactate synthase large subunit-like protein
MMMLTGGQAVVKSLSAEGVEVVFGIPGVHAVAIYDALYDYPQVRHITTRHEQGAAYMADGYIRASGKPGVCITTTGPGAFNSITAMGEAYASSSPVINITTQIHSSLLGKDKGAIHESKDQLGVFRPVTGWNKRVESIKDVSPAIHEAFRRIKTLRPRPVELEFPIDVLNGWDDVEILSAERYQRAKGAPDRVKEAADCLATSKKPVIWAGGGVIGSEASEELVRLAELLQAPVLTTGTGKTVMPSEHPLCLGKLGRGWGGFDSPLSRSLLSKFLEESDVMLAVGTRFGAVDTINWTLRFPEKLIQIDIDEAELGKNYPCPVGIAGDARAVLEQLMQQLPQGSERTSRVEEVSAIKEAIYQGAKKRAPEEIQMLEDIRAVAGPGAIMTIDATAASYWGGMFLKVIEPRTEMVPWGFAGLGFALPAGIGAKVACPDKPVIVLVGDGGFLFTGQELATAVQFGINIVVVIFNDSCYGALRSMQQRWFGDRCIAVDLRNPDYLKFAESFGAAAIEVSSLLEVRDALKKALSSDTTSVIVAPMSLRSPIDDSELPSPMQPRPSK